MNAKSFEQYALAAAEEIFRKHDIAVMVGGTGLYIKAFTEGMDVIPTILPELRSGIEYDYRQKGISWLHEELVKYDPIFVEKGEMLNPARMMRALEVVKATGRSLFSFHGQARVERNFGIKKFGLQLGKEELHANIDFRVDQMFEEGIVQEVRELLEYRQLKALQTVGYQELFEYFDGKISLDTAKQLIKKNTRQYAKRQMTWFMRDPAITWVDAHMDPVEFAKSILME